MLGLFEYENNQMIHPFLVIPQNINRMWGSDFMIMDSHSIKGGIGGFDYENMSDMFQNMWNVYGQRLFCGSDTIRF
jgi:hypothetical protein